MWGLSSVEIECYSRWCYSVVLWVGKMERFDGLCLSPQGNMAHPTGHAGSCCNGMGHGEATSPAWGNGARHPKPKGSPPVHQNQPEIVFKKVCLLKWENVWNRVYRVEREEKRRDNKMQRKIKIKMQKCAKRTKCK